MDKRNLVLKVFNSNTNEFEATDIITGVGSVKMEDGTTLEEKITALERKLDGLEQREVSAGIIISESPPENPVDGQIWMRLVPEEPAEE